MPGRPGSSVYPGTTVSIENVVPRAAVEHSILSPLWSVVTSSRSSCNELSTTDSEVLDQHLERAWRGLVAGSVQARKCWCTWCFGGWSRGSMATSSTSRTRHRTAAGGSRRAPGCRQADPGRSASPGRPVAVEPLRDQRRSVVAGFGPGRSGDRDSRHGVPADRCRGYAAGGMRRSGADRPGAPPGGLLQHHRRRRVRSVRYGQCRTARSRSARGRGWSHLIS